MNRRQMVQGGIGLAFLSIPTFFQVSRGETSANSVILYLDEISKGGNERLALVRDALNAVVERFQVQIEILDIRLESIDRTREILANTLARRHDVALILAPNFHSAAAAYRISQTHLETPPILFSIHSDPVRAGFAQSLERPAGNMTGETFDHQRHHKLIELTWLIEREKTTVGFLSDDFMLSEMDFVTQTAQVAQSRGYSLQVINAESKGFAIEALLQLVRSGEILTWIAPDCGWLAQSNYEAVRRMQQAGARIVTDHEAALRAGAMMCLQPDIVDGYQAWSRQAELVLSKFPTAEIPVEIPHRFFRSINLGVASAMGVVLSNRELATFNTFYQA